MSAASTDRARRLVDSFGLVAPSLPAELVTPEAVPWLTAVAGVLPPVHRAGLECRLSAEAGTVDLQQGFSTAGGEPACLARFLTQAEPLNEAWQAVLRLALRWSAEDDLLHQNIDELWLELDATPRGQRGSLRLRNTHPSPFTVLKHAGAERSLAAARAVTETLLGRAAAAELDDTLKRCAEACPPPAQISHVGVMLGREVSALRVHVSRLPLPELEPFLERVRWAGDRREVRTLAAALLDHGDALIVCLDLVNDRLVRLGLECFFSQKQGLDPRWQPLLERLVDLGLSAAEKADALLRWPGTLTPLTSGDSWPEDLILQSLARPDDVLGVVERRLSHVKLTCTPGAPVNAKAYFGFGHVWTSGLPATGCCGRTTGPDG